MNLHNYQAFLAVYETQSFTKAAQKLFITQPTISKRVAALETLLGKPLFNRIERKVTLNEAGRALLPIARDINLNIIESQRVINDIDGEIRGSLKLIASHHIGIHHLPLPLNALINAHPKLHIDLAFMDSESTCHEIECANYELAMITLPPKVSKAIKILKSWPDPLVLAVGKTHPLLHNGTIELSDLSQYPATLPERDTYTRELIERNFLQKMISLKIGLETNYLETIRSMVQIGLGWSILPKTMINKSLQHIHIQDTQWQRELGIICHTQRSLSNAALGFIKEIEKLSQFNTS